MFRNYSIDAHRGLSWKDVTRFLHSRTRNYIACPAFFMLDPPSKPCFYLYNDSQFPPFEALVKNRSCSTNNLPPPDTSGPIGISRVCNPSPDTTTLLVPSSWNCGVASVGPGPAKSIPR